MSEINPSAPRNDTDVILGADGLKTPQIETSCGLEGCER